MTIRTHLRDRHHLSMPRRVDDAERAHIYQHQHEVTDHTHIADGLLTGAGIKEAVQKPATDPLSAALDAFIAAVRDVPAHTRALSADMTEIQLADTILDVVGLNGRRRLIAAINARARQILLTYPEDMETGSRARLLREVDADLDAQDPNINREAEML